MDVTLIYNEDYDRIVPAVLIDTRITNTFIQGSNGWVINSYVELELQKIASNVLFYRIESALGSLVGYCMIQVNETTLSASILSLNVRNCFNNDKGDVANQINNFITNGTWFQDYLQ